VSGDAVTGRSDGPFERDELPEQHLAAIEEFLDTYDTDLGLALAGDTVPIDSPVTPPLRARRQGSVLVLPAAVSTARGRHMPARQPLYRRRARDEGR
jgi:hypothetical protein